MKLKIGVGGLLCLFLWSVSCNYSFGFQVSILSDHQVAHRILVGDSVPDVGIIPILNYKYASVRLSDFKDKLLVLDFWATTCGSCLEAMPSIAALQSQYKGRLQVIDVDYERADYVAAYLAKHPAKRALGLPVIASDVLLKKMFPYQYLPHIVWIRNGVFIGATDGDYLDAANIEKVLENKDFTFSDVTNSLAVTPDYHLPLFCIASGVNENTSVAAFNPLSSAVFTGAIPGVPLKAGWDTTGGKLRFYAVNHPLLNLYALALNSGLPFIANRRILDVHDSSLLLNINHLYSDKWMASHSYCAEIILSGHGRSRNRAMALLRQQMEASLGLVGIISKRQTDCLSLGAVADSMHSAYRVKEISFDAVKPGPVHLHHINLDDLAWLMNDRPGIPPVLVELSSRVSFDLDLAALPESLSEWRAVLSAQGIVLKDCKQMLDMFVLSDNPEGNHLDSLSRRAGK